jgi:hypothetical protein
MHSLTPDGLAIIAGAMFMAGFVAIAIWLLHR